MPLDPNFSMLSSAPPAPQTAQRTSAVDPGISAGNFNIVWGNDHHSETATATIKDNQNKTVGQVVFDTRHDTVTVTSYRVASAGLTYQAPGESAKSSTFKIDSSGNVVNNGDLTSRDAAPDRYDSFTTARHQQVMLRDATSDSPGIGVDIAHDQDSSSDHALKALITLPTASGSPFGVDQLLIKSGGLDDDYNEVNGKKLTAQYTSDWAGEHEQKTTYTSPMPPPDHSIMGFLRSLFD